MQHCIILASILFLYGCSDEQSNNIEKATSDPVVLLTDWCFENWKEQQWTLGDSNLPAIDNLAFAEGVRKVCRARAELYAEGYEIYPFISDTMQREIYALVFSSDIEDIKSHIKQHLPKLRRI